MRLTGGRSLVHSLAVVEVGNVRLRQRLWWSTQLSKKTLSSFFQGTTEATLVLSALKFSFIRFLLLFRKWTSRRIFLSIYVRPWYISFNCFSVVSLHTISNIPLTSAKGLYIIAFILKFFTMHSGWVTVTFEFFLRARSSTVSLNFWKKWIPSFVFWAWSRRYSQYCYRLKLSSVIFPTLIVTLVYAYLFKAYILQIGQNNVLGIHASKQLTPSNENTKYNAVKAVNTSF